jgi:hypothetical protein
MKPKNPVTWIRFLPESSSAVDAMVDAVDTAGDEVVAALKRYEAVVASAKEFAARHWTHAEIRAAKKYAKEKGV